MGDKRWQLGLWTVPGLGPLTLEALQRREGGLGSFADLPAREWKHLPEVGDTARAHLTDDFLAGPAADQVLERHARLNIKMAFKDEPAYPPRLREVTDAPPVVFYVGPGATTAPRRRLAMVGTRRPEREFEHVAKRLALEVAELGVCIVSGGAAGIDQLCHRAAGDRGAETWAFIGSSLDEIDFAQLQLWHELEPKGATFWSEYPPRVRAGPGTFPRRNRLISGASDAVLVLRAAIKSGSRYTAEAARRQGRPVLALPGEMGRASAAYCNQLIKSGAATLCESARQAVEATGATGLPSHQPAAPTAPGVDPGSLSPNARVALEVVPRQPVDFEELQVDSRLSSGALLAALSELEINGLVVQHPNRRYERL